MPAVTLPRCRYILPLTLVLMMLAGCNTLEGAGKDIQKAGEALENSADRDD